MLVRTLIGEGRIVHWTTVEDPDSPTAVAWNGLCGKAHRRRHHHGGAALENETRMLSWYVARVGTDGRGYGGPAPRCRGCQSRPVTCSEHDLQRWLALGPNDAVIPSRNRLRPRSSFDGSLPPRCRLLFNLPASAILHQSSAAIGRPGSGGGDGRRLRVGMPDSRVMAQSSGKASRTTYAKL